MRFISALVVALLLLWAGSASAQHDRRLLLLNGGGSTPVIDLNFTTGTMPSGVTFARTTVATTNFYTDAAGSSVSSVAINAPRMLAAGFLSEEPRTQLLLNSAAPVTQTTGTLATGTYTFWCIGTGSVTSTQGTATASGIGAITCSQSTFQTIVVTVTGTLTFTVSGSVNRFQLELGAIPTSFISSAGVTLTRTADTASMAFAPFLPTNPTALTFIGKYTTPLVTPVSTQPLLVFQTDDGTTSNRVMFRHNNATNSPILNFSVISTVNQFSATLSATPASSTVTRFWYALSGGNSAAQVIGQTKQTSTVNPVLPGGQTTLRIGNANNAILNSTIAKLRVYNTRLSDTLATQIATGM